MTHKWFFLYKDLTQYYKIELVYKQSIVKWIKLFMAPLFLVFSNSINAEEYTRTYTKEIIVNEMPTVSTNVTSSLSLKVRGNYSHRSNTKYGYIIKGKSQKDRFYIHKDYVIETWDMDRIRQEVDVTIKSKDQEAAQFLLDQLEIELLANKSGHILVDANMNFKTFSLTNRWFKDEVCKVELNDGTTYEVDYLEIKARLFVPVKSNLKVKSILHHTLRLGNLEGDLDLDLQYGEVYGNKINNLNANLRFCFNVIFNEANNVVTSATKSHLKIDKVRHIELGKLQLEQGALINGDKIKWLDYNSSLNLYNFKDIGKMIIHNSAYDDFKIGEINDLEVASSIYSNYKISKLKTDFEFKGKNADISISEVEREFVIIDIQNKLSKLNINIADGGNYSLNLYDQQLLESNLPVAAQLIERKGPLSSTYKIGKGKSTGEINIRCERCELDMRD